MTAERPCLGVAYYPEQWPRERWHRDAELMAQAGLAVVRVGEFAWAQLEPRPGDFQLDWLDDAIGILAGAGLEVIVGTPTAAPPAWLIERHPEILPVRADGDVQPFGHRRHYCPNAPAMREAAVAIVRALAERFGDDDRVTAWQIDNELGGRCFCDLCREAFHGWLRERYEALEVLNEVWGTAFWSQVYDGWGQIPLPEGMPVPLPDGFLRNSPNPGLALDFRRFSSESLIGFLRLQARALRQLCSPPQRVTHNLMGFRYHEVDYHELAAELDFVSWDNYPLLDRSGRWSTAALGADAMRGLKDAPVWVLEQQVGPLGWELLRTPRRGDTRLLTWQAIAHGAEVVCYFRWRTPRFGAEQHWHGILDAQGRAGRRYDEVRALAAEIAEHRAFLGDVRPRADAALVHDYDSRFALQVQPTNPALGYEESVQAHYEALRRLGLGVDVISPHAELSAYRVVAAPSLYVMDEATAAALAAFVEGGGVLVLAPRVGAKDRCNAVPERPLPAWLDELSGLEVVDYASQPEGGSARLAGIDGVSFHGELYGWYEELELHGARVVAEYVDGPFAGAPALAEHAVGDGRAVYLAGVARLPTLVTLYRLLCGDAGLPLLELPEGVEALPLQANGAELLLLLNHADDERLVELGAPTWRDHVTGSGGNGAIRLPPLELALVEATPRRAVKESREPAYEDR